MMVREALAGERLREMELTGDPWLTGFGVVFFKENLLSIIGLILMVLWIRTSWSAACNY